MVQEEKTPCILVIPMTFVLVLTSGQKYIENGNAKTFTVHIHALWLGRDLHNTNCILSSSFLCPIVHVNSGRSDVLEVMEELDSTVMHHFHSLCEWATG